MKNIHSFLGSEEALQEQICSASPHQRNYKPRRYDMGGFDESVHPEVNAMHREAQWFLNDIFNGVRPRRWLSLLGVSGVGKTHLAEQIDKILSQKMPNTQIEFWKWQKIVELYRSGDFGIAEYLVSVPAVLIIDDIGSENLSDGTRSALLRIADGRLEKWTVLTSNLTSGDIGRNIDARISSRLFRGNNVVCELINAPDYCFAKHKKTLTQNKACKKHKKACTPIHTFMLFLS